jgi:lambda family phage minor tail protein L
VQEVLLDEMAALENLDISIIGVCQNIFFGGHEYHMYPVKGEGWSNLDTHAALPRPTLHLSNVYGMVSPYLMRLNDLVKAKVTRRKTFARFLDGMPEAPQEQGAMRLEDEVFYIQSKPNDDRQSVSFELASILDDDQATIGREITLNMCSFLYRRFNTETGEFDYTGCTCPWTDEANYFDEFGNPTAREFDACSRQLLGCLQRYRTRFLPFGGVLGMAYKS